MKTDHQLHPNLSGGIATFELLKEFPDIQDSLSQTAYGHLYQHRDQSTPFHTIEEWSLQIKMQDGDDVSQGVI
jgi:hypothetical protein